MAETTPKSAEMGDGAVCPNCGVKAPAGQRFCGECGAKLPLVTAPAVPPEVPSPPVEPAPVAAVATAVAEGVPVSAPAVPAATAAPAVPVSAPAAPAPATPPAPARPVLSDAARERERDRLLTLANVQRMRGQTGEARKTLESVADLYEGRPDREVATVQELRGDLLASEGKIDDALAAYEKAHSLDPNRVSAEKKFAEMTLRVAEAKAIASGSMLGMGGDSLGFGSFGGGTRGKRNPGMAMLMSAFVPGFGQLFNGDLLKAGICLALFLLTMLAIFLTPGNDVMFAKMAALFAPTRREAQIASESLSPIIIGLLVIAGLTWIYSVADAVTSASKTTDTIKGVTPPAGDRSGWEP